MIPLIAAPGCLPPCSLQPRGIPRGGAGAQGLGRGAPPSHWFPHLSTWQRQAPTSETRKVVRLEAALPRRSPKDSRPGLGEWRRGRFVRNMMCVCVRGRDAFGWVGLGSSHKRDRAQFGDSGSTGSSAPWTSVSSSIQWERRKGLYLPWVMETGNAWGIRKKLSSKSGV